MAMAMAKTLCPTTGRLVLIISTLTALQSISSRRVSDAIMLLSRCRNHAARDRQLGARFFASTSTSTVFIPMQDVPAPWCQLKRQNRYHSFHFHQRHNYHNLHHRKAASVRIRTAMSWPLTVPSAVGVSSSTSSSFGRRNLSSLRAQTTTCNDEIEHQQQCIELPQKSADRNGLLRYVVLADDGHPLRLYARAPRHHQQQHTHDDKVNGNSGFSTYNALLSTSKEDNGKNEKINNSFDIQNDQQQQQQQRSILLLHGRTWSSQPVFDLRTSDDDHKRQSTLQSLADLGFAAYALDLRGFGETPRDYRYDGDNDDENEKSRSGGYTTPMRCVADVKCAIEWITKRHSSITTVSAADAATRGDDDEDDNSNMSINTKPALLGWSQGALVAQMYAQLHGPTTLSDLILFGSIYDPKTIYPRKPLYLNFDQSYANQQRAMAAPENANTEVAALEDFTLPGTICDEAASAFSTLALEVDPIKAAWDDLHEFNICNPALVHVPTMVMAGSQDPYVSWDAQRELFDRLGTEDKAMCILPGCDHAAHILKARRMFIRAVAGFLLRKDEF